MNLVRIPLPREFSFELAISFLLRSPKELLHRVEDSKVMKALRAGESILLCLIGQDKNDLRIEFFNKKPTAQQQHEAVEYIREWFDLDTDLKPFYSMAAKDPLLKGVGRKVSWLPYYWPTRFI